MAKLSLKDFYKYLRDFVDNNPDLITNIGLSIPVFVKMLKNGTLKAVITETIKGVRGGFTVKQAFSNALTSSATTKAIASGVKVTAIAAAAAFAFGTLKEAFKYGEATIKGDDTGWDKIWKFAWNTSIPGATINQFRSFATWLKSKPSQPAEKSNWVTDPLPPVEKSENKTLEQKVMDKLNVTKTGEANKTSYYTGYNYDEEARKLGLGSRPANPQAENQWKKEVERQMKIKKATPIQSGGNAPTWYVRGKAPYLLSTDLTWTGIKQYEKDQLKFALTCCIDVSLVPPVEAGKLHPQVISNNRILFQGLRGKNTGAYQYTEEDVYHYTTALMSFIARWRYIAKLISVVNTRDVQVRDLPIRIYNTIFYLVGKANYDQVIANKPNMTEQLNTLAKDINTWALPGSTMISRWNYIADKALKDYQGPKPVYGIYAIKNMIGYDSNGAKLVEFAKNKSIQDYIDDLKADYESWASNPVYLKVAGDMMKLFGAGKETFNNVPMLTGAESIKYEYDPEAVDQLRSAKFFYTKMSSYVFPSYDRVTDANYEMEIKTTQAGIYAGGILEISLDDWTIISDRNKKLTSAENIMLTQFCYNAKRTDSGATNAATQVFRIEDGTSTILEDMTVLYTDTAAADAGVTLFAGLVTFESATNFTVNGNAINVDTRLLSVLKQIDYLPGVQMIRTVASNYIGAAGVFVDVDNYANMSTSQFKALNNVAVYSLTHIFDPEDLKIMGLIG